MIFIMPNYIWSLRWLFSFKRCLGSFAYDYFLQKCSLETLWFGEILIHWCKFEIARSRIEIQGECYKSNTREHISASFLWHPVYLDFFLFSSFSSLPCHFFLSFRQPSFLYPAPTNSIPFCLPSLITMASLSHCLSQHSRYVQRWPNRPKWLAWLLLNCTNSHIYSFHMERMNEAWKRKAIHVPHVICGLPTLCSFIAPWIHESLRKKKPKQAKLFHVILEFDRFPTLHSIHLPLMHYRLVIVPCHFLPPKSIFPCKI